VTSREFGSYRLEEKLGEGGMGEVWRAQHRLLARPAAVKLIRGAHARHDAVAVSEDAIRRFEREARATASLRSPHTVQLFDFGVSTDGAFYYAMELLDGLTVEALVQGYGPLPAERVIHVLQQMCHSLSEASWRGLVHRDIKPSNVVLCQYGEDFDFVKILDFGIVRSAASDQDATLVTRDDVVQGTPAFMSPEQVLGTSLDERTDIYATGCVAYWMLTGKLVFEAESLMALAAHHVHTPPARPSTRTELPIPPALDALVMDCLEKNCANRPTSARELSRRLSAIHLDQVWSDSRAREWWSVHQPGRAA
jgi:serine/threonine-protein kinase